MKLLIVLYAITVSFVSSQNSIYNIQIVNLDNAQINLSSFNGKTILVTALNSAKPSATCLKRLDSLVISYPNLVVIAVPGTDFEGSGNEENIKQLRDSLGVNILITKQASVKKIAGIDQHPLFKWLTHLQENNHFDADVDSEGQLFIVNQLGKLYSVLSKETSTEVVRQVLSQPVNN